MASCVTRGQSVAILLDDPVEKANFKKKTLSSFYLFSRAKNLCFTPCTRDKTSFLELETI
jgi:hypothetical protein